MLLRLIRLVNLPIKGFLAEVASIATSKERLKKLWHIPLYSNAVYLMVAQVIAALLGFAFWVMVARSYSPVDVGLASALIAAMGLLVLFSRLGMGWGLIRFLPHSGKNASSIINTVFVTGILTSTAVTFIFVAGLSFWSPALLFMRHDPVYLTAFVLFTIVSTLSILVDHAFIASRRAGFTLSRGLIFNLLKLPLPIMLAVFFHSFGIFASWGISLCVALLLSFLLFLPRVQPGYRPRFTLSRGVVNEMVHFSFANYIGTLFWAAPGMLLPLIVVNLLGAESNAYFYIASALGGGLTMVPGAISMSLFAEGSYEEERLGLNIRRSLKMTYLILVPAVILILAIAGKLLLLFGSSYAENATTLLRIIAITALPLSVNIVYLAIKRVEKNLKMIVGLSAFIAVITLGLTYLLLPRMGINGAGLALLGSHSIIALVIIASWLKGRRALHWLATALISGKGD